MLSDRMYSTNLIVATDFRFYDCVGFNDLVYTYVHLSNFTIATEVKMLARTTNNRQVVIL